jgi:hypothetical protein
VPFSGFKPINPPLQYQGGFIGTGWNHWPAVNSLNPLLSWGRFPGEHHEMLWRWEYMEKVGGLKGRGAHVPQANKIKKYIAGRFGDNLASFQWVVTPFVKVDQGRFSQISYDLRIWEVGRPHRDRVRRRDTPKPDLIYEKSGIKENQHRVVKKLRPDSLYYWTVRARFLIDDTERLSEWSMITDMPGKVYQGHELPTGCPSWWSLENSFGCSFRYLARYYGYIPHYLFYRFSTPIAEAVPVLVPR